VLIEAAVLQLEAERTLGGMLRGLLKAGMTAEGRWPKGAADRVTLDDSGLTKMVSSKAQRWQGCRPQSLRRWVPQPVT
jgi:hypothetical protein